MHPSNDSVRETGERGVIKRLARRLAPGREVSVGIGDDTAVVRPSDAASDWALTTDPVVEGIHFTAHTEPERIGHKAVGRVLSDLAAMGASPDWLLVDLVAPSATPVSRLERIYDGIQALAGRYDAAVIGGDVSGGEPLQLHVFGLGRIPRGTALTRAGAQPGDLLYVTGELGASFSGRHLDFEPRVAEGLWLRAEGWAKAAMDVSDGLAADLFRMLQASGTGARIRLESIPVSTAANALCDARSPLEHALQDGEDYELLFAIPASRSTAFEKAWAKRFPLRCTRIGEMTEQTGKAEAVDENGNHHPMREGGFEHFRAGPEKDPP